MISQNLYLHVTQIQTLCRWSIWINPVLWRKGCWRCWIRQYTGTGDQ